MEWWNNLSSNEKLLALFIGFILMAGLFENAPILIFFLILFGIMYAARDRRENRTVQQQINQYERQYAPPQQEPRRPRDEIQPHAMTAVRRAGLDPQAVQILTVDIGVMSFHADQQPVIHRTWPIDDDCDYIQPFIQLRVPRNAAGKITFEIFDKDGELAFMHEDDYQLQDGTNLIVPAARLPVHDEQENDGTWEIRVSVGNMVIARHEFRWEATEDPEFTRHVGEDGEISNELRAALYDSRIEKLSIDDLLSYQDDDQQEAAQ